MEWVSQTIANSDTFQVELNSSVSIEKVVGDGRHIMAGVAFSGNIEITANVLGVLLEEAFQKCCNIFGNLGFISDFKDTS